MAWKAIIASVIALWCWAMLVIAFLLAESAFAGDGAAFRRWCEAGRPDDDKPSLGESFYGLVVESDRTIRIYDQRLGWFKLAAPFHAIGSGHELAIGAMAAGASAIEAVKIAIQYESGCGGPIQVEVVGAL